MFVPVQLCTQGVRFGEALCVSQTTDEIDTDNRAIPVERRVEDVRFDATRVIIECRTRSYVYHAAEYALRRLHTDGVNAIWR